MQLGDLRDLPQALAEAVELDPLALAKPRHDLDEGPRVEQAAIDALDQGVDGEAFDVSVPPDQPQAKQQVPGLAPRTVLLEQGLQETEPGRAAVPYVVHSLP